MNRQGTLLGIFTLVTIVCAVGIISSEVNRSAERPEHTIRISMLGSAQDEDYDGAMAFKRHVEAASTNEIRVELFPSGQFCGTERECLEALQSGVLQVFMFTTGGFGSVYGPAQVLDLPYAFENDAIAECVLDGPIIDALGETTQKADLGIRLMTVSNTGGWRNFATTDQPVRSPADLKGRKIRTITAPLQQELVRELGGNPTPVSWPEVYTALATGVVDGTKNGIHDIVSMQLHEQIKFVLLDGHAYMGGLWWYSEVSWQTLSEDEQKIVQQGFNLLKTTTRAAIKRWEQESSKAFIASGGTLITPDAETRQAFRDSVQGIRDWYRQSYGEAWLVQLDDAVNLCHDSAPKEPQ